MSSFQTDMGISETQYSVITEFLKTHNLSLDLAPKVYLFLNPYLQHDMNIQEQLNLHADAVLTYITTLHF